MWLIDLRYLFKKGTWMRKWKLHFNLALATYMPLIDSFAFLFGRQTYWIQTFLSSAMQAATGVYVRDFWL